MESDQILAMESDQILAKVNTGEAVPDSWLVFPLLRQQLILGLFGWAFGALLGGGLFALMAPIVIPHNYQGGALAATITTVLLVIVLYVCLGSLWSIISDIRRLRRISQHLIVITPNDFVKQEGKKIIHVPLEYVKHVTARGTPQVDRSLETARQDAQIGGSSGGIASFIVGRRVAEAGERGSGRKRMRTPTTLAFIDERTDQEVIVVTDKAYGDPYFIAAHLKEYARSKIRNNVM
ncbi:MAG: hypothetical protein ACRDHZ_21600 [Ktedonobacteraceae bacterium]